MSTTGTLGTMKRSGSLRFDTSRFRRNIQKHISRTKEKVLHNLDKAEKTDDEFIKKSEAILIKKQASTVKLQTELKRHLKALKNVSASSRSLHETMLDAYEDNWAGRKEFADALVTLDSSWLHYFNTLCTVLEQVGSHIDEFVKLKDKLEKRKRKLVDYNLAKRNLYLASTAKKKDEHKLKKAQRDVEFVESTYHSLNHELRTDLPIFYDSHVHFCCENWSYLLENEECMYTHLLSTVHKFMSSLDQLRDGYQNADYRLADVELSYSDINRSSLSLSTEATYANGDLYETCDFADVSRRRGSVELSRPSKPVAGRAVQRHSSTANHFGRSDTLASSRSRSVGNVVSTEDIDIYGFLPGPLSTSGKSSILTIPPRPPINNLSTSVRSEEEIYNADHHVYAEIDRLKKSGASNTSSSSKQEDTEPKMVNNVSGVASSASSSVSSRHPSASRLANDDSPQVDKTRKADNLPLRMAVHPYSSQDEDELDLAVNDLVQVLPWENENLKEDGWLFGMKLPESKKGLFPENHTIVFVT